MEPPDSQDSLSLSTSTGEVSQSALILLLETAKLEHLSKIILRYTLQNKMIRASVEHGLSWAVAGRSEGKLHAVLDKAGKAVGADLSSTAIIVSELFNPS